MDEGRRHGGGVDWAGKKLAAVAWSSPGQSLERGQEDLAVEVDVAECSEDLGAFL
jgi:hypothetical protein